MIHVGLHSVGTYHKKFERQNLKNKNIICRVSRYDTRQRVLCRVSTMWHSAKKPLCRVPAVDSRQRLTAVSSGTAADGFAESPLCRVFDTRQTCLCRVPPCAESITLSSAALGKVFFAECPTKGTRQRIQHSAKPRIPVVKDEIWRVAEKDERRTIHPANRDGPHKLTTVSLLQWGR
jgi:hypothetical protein